MELSLQPSGSIWTTIKKLAEKPQVAFDVGAGRGTTSRKFLSMWPNISVYAFEPSSGELKHLRPQAAKNPNWHICEMAISSCTGSATFYTHSQDNVNSLFPDGPALAESGIKFVKGVNVSTVTLDDFCRGGNIKRIDVLKFDIQGGELEALRGASELLEEKRIGVIMAELLYVPFYEGQCWAYEVEAFLAGYGYRLHYLSLVYQEDRLMWADGVFVETTVPPSPARPKKPAPVEKAVPRVPSDLVKATRLHWFNNKRHSFKLPDGQKITRAQIQLYGGPNRKFDGCQACQESEWLSRIGQKNLFQKHSCPSAAECRNLCKKQGDEMWTYLHQDFTYAELIDPALKAPKCLFLCPGKLSRVIMAKIRGPHAYGWGKVLLRRLAQACQFEFATSTAGITWDDYDFVYVINMGDPPNFERPPIPIVMYGHDHWREHDGYQAMLDHVKPEIFLTPYPESWTALYQIPPETQVRFYCHSESQFFTRPNLGEKKYDLVVPGARRAAIYAPRRSLDEQLKPLTSSHKIFLHVNPGDRLSTWDKPVKSGNATYLNAYSELLGSARYVAFGPCEAPIEPVLIKNYEILGSGAIPILPAHQRNLALLGIEPMVHYIPFAQIWNNNTRLVYFLDHYDDFKHIAENAVAWHKENTDKMLFDDFEDLIREVTEHKYPRRLING